MAHGDDLADRVRAIMQREPGMREKRMFGGAAFLVHGNLAVSAGEDVLLVRVAPEQAPSLLAEQHVRRMEMRGRAMTGWLQVDADLLGTDDELRRWVGYGLACARSLPAK